MLFRSHTYSLSHIHTLTLGMPTTAIFRFLAITSSEIAYAPLWIGTEDRETVESGSVSVSGYQKTWINLISGYDMLDLGH